jgi:DNA-binding protein Fis
MAMAGGNKTHAARMLGIDRRSLYRRLDKSAADDAYADKPTPAI